MCACVWNQFKARNETSRNTCPHTIKIKHRGSPRHVDGRTQACSAVCFLCGSREVVGDQGELCFSPPGKSSLGLVLKLRWDHGQEKPSGQQELHRISQEARKSFPLEAPLRAYFPECSLTRTNQKARICQENKWGCRWVVNTKGLTH